MPPPPHGKPIRRGTRRSIERGRPTREEWILACRKGGGEEGGLMERTSRRRCSLCRSIARPAKFAMGRVRRAWGKAGAVLRHRMWGDSIRLTDGTLSYTKDRTLLGAALSIKRRARGRTTTSTRPRARERTAAALPRAPGTTPPDRDRACGSSTVPPGASSSCEHAIHSLVRTVQHRACVCRWCAAGWIDRVIQRKNLSLTSSPYVPRPMSHHTQKP